MRVVSAVRVAGVVLLVGLVASCSSKASPAASATSSAAPASVPASAAAQAPDAASEPSGAASTANVPLPASSAVYPWGPAGDRERLDARFRETPKGFTRVAVGAGSFAAFLRTLPLEAPSAPVVDYRGQRLYDDGRHPNIAAVAALDVGTRDLQHCADAIIRLHAEWRYGKGDRDISYRAVSGQPLAYRGFVAGDRAVARGNDIVMRRVAGAKADDHALFRSWLDDVFNWAGTASIERDGKKVPGLAAIEAGDFFVMSGSPFGHAVLVLDVAKDERGRLALLLGQSYMPAQSFQILRPAAGSEPWFVVDPSDSSVTTPFWRPFPVGSLRRFG